MSMGGRITLIKSVPSCIPIYYLSCFKCPKSVLRRIKKFQHDFLWNDTMEKRKHQLVRWEIMCSPISQGSLGIRSLEKLIKRFWGSGYRGCESSKGKWRQILISIRWGNDGWCLPCTDNRASAMIRYRAHDGQQIRFLHDVG